MDEALNKPPTNPYKGSLRNEKDLRPARQCGTVKTQLVSGCYTHPFNKEGLQLPVKSTHNAVEYMY